MLNIRYIETEASELKTIYERMEDDLLRNIAKRLNINDEVLDMNEWQLNKLMELGQMNKENIAIIAKYAKKAAPEIQKVIKNSGYNALEHDETVYEEAFNVGKLKVMAVPMTQSPVLQKIIRTAVQHAANELNLVNTTAHESARKAFTDAVNQAYLETVTGVYSHQEAIKKAVKNLGEQGIKGAHYMSVNGKHTWNHIDVAVRRAILTSSSQVAGEMQLARAGEWGSDLVEVTSHMGARPSHAEWQGRIYSLSGKHQKYKNFYEVTQYGSGTGLKGYNCSHDFYPYFEGISEQTYKPYDIEENNKVYRQSQEQRSIERDIRKEKRKIITAEAAGDHQGVLKYNQHLKDKQAEIRQFIDGSGRTRRRDREQVVGYNKSAETQAKTVVTQTQFPKPMTKEAKRLPKPMDKIQYERTKAGLKRQGVEVISAKGDDLKYLKSIGAEATIIEDNLILHRGKIPSASAFFEEIIHIHQQKKYGVLSSNDISELCFREIEAQNKLLKNAKAYKFTKADTKDITNNLKRWENRLRKETGYDFEEYKILRDNR